MSNYAESIDPLDYKYRAKVYIQELSGVYKTDVIVRMELKAADFNFDLAQDSGNDFRLAEQSNGGGVFKMWKPVWVKNSEFALMYFKLPAVFADQQLELTAFWGNETVNSISDPTIMDALFIQEFASSPLDFSKWEANDSSVLSQSVNAYGYRLRWGNTGWYLWPTELPLTGLKEWILEAGGFIESDTYQSGSRSFRIYFEGTENIFDINFYGSNNSYGLRHNIRYSGTTYQNISACQGLECGSYVYNQIYIAYKESTDKGYIKLLNRPTLDDYSGSWERNVEDETKLDRMRIYAYDYAGDDGPVFRLKWLLIRNYADDAEMSDFDLSNLYIENEYISHQTIDHNEYGDDVTDVGFEHQSNSGDAYPLSDNLHDSLSNSWVIDETVDQMWATINFGGGADLTDESLRHYDSDHVVYLNASKLSNDTDDVNDNNAWHGTTSSGYACIDFGLNNNKPISALSVQAVPGALNNMPKDFIFTAGNSDPRLSNDDRWLILYEGNFEYTEDIQYIYFNNDSAFRYYKLVVLSTFTGADIKLYTWHMYEHIQNTGKKVVSKLRLLPLVGGDYEYNFPKAIKFSASNDGITWTSFFDVQTNDALLEDECRGGTPTAQNEGQGSASNAFDSILTTSWAPAQSTGDTWIAYEFDVPKIINKIRINIGLWWTANAYFQGADSASGPWTTLYTWNVSPPAEVWATYDFENEKSYKIYRFYGPRTTHWYVRFYEIEMYDASNLEYRPTYTPLYDYGGSRWQEYSFENITPYYMYKLECDSNWSTSNDNMIIAEWEMYEKITEEYTNRILEGSSDNYNSVWLLDESTFDDISFLAANNVLNMAHNDFLGYYESFAGDLSGRGAPTIGVGNYGDEYLDVLTGRIYVKDILIYSTDKTGAGTASASFNQSGHPPEDAFDDNNSTYFSNYGYTENEPQWLGYDFGAGNEETIAQISLLMTYQSDIEAFTFRASNDNTVWDTLHVEPAYIPASNETRLFSFDNDTAYRYYRIYGDQCHQTGHGLYAFIITEMEMMQFNYYDWRLVSTGSDINDVNAI